MNLEESKRLVQQIRAAVDNPQRQFREQRLAKEYTETCRAVNLRLQQVSTFLQGDDILKAIQLAEVTPKLLDLVTVLNFDSLSRWRKLCDQRGYLLPEPFDEDQVRRLLEEYEREVDIHHPLYREYRQAEMLGQDVRALKILRLVHHLKPEDRNASEESGRLERKISAKRLAILRGAIQDKDDDTVCQIVDELEELEFSLGGDLPLWQKAQQVRIQAGLKKIDQYKSEKAWRDVRDEAVFLESLRSRFQVELERDIARTLNEATEWAKGEEEAFREDRRFKKALGDLQHMLNICEEKYLSVRKRPLAELRSDYELLSRKWQEVQRYERTLDEDVEERFDKYYRLLRYQVRQRERVNKMVYFGVAVLFVAILSVSVMLVQAHRRAHQLADELESQERSRSVIAGEQFLANIAEQDGKLISIPRLKSAVNQTQQFIAKEQAQRQIAMEKVDWLIQQAENRFIELAPEQYQQRLAEAEEVKASIAPDYQPELDEKIALFRALWDAYLYDEKEARSDRFEKELVVLEKVAREKLSEAEPLSVIKTALEQIDDRMPVLDALTTPVLDVLKVKEEITFRYEALKERAGTMSRQITQWDSVTGQLDNPESLNGFVASLNQYQSSNFADPAQLRKAREITNLRPTTEKMIQHLITFEDAKKFQAVTSGQPLKLFPDQFVGAERRLMDSMKGDVFLTEVKRFELTEVARKDGDPLKKRTVYIRGQLEKDKFGRLKGMIYDPSLSADAVKFEEKQLAPAEYELLDQGDLKEFAFFNESGLGALTDGAADSLSVSLLELVDKLHRDRSLSPAFRTFVLYRLVLMADARPSEWGWQWAPSGRGLRKQLQELGADTVQSGDWLVPKRNTEFAEKMKEYYNRSSALALSREANFLFQLTQRAARDGFEFVGYVDPVKLVPAAVSKASANRVDLWGWSGKNKKPAKLFSFDKDQDAFVSVTEPLAYSPLFIVPSDSEKTLRIAADAASYNLQSLNRSILPKLFEQE